MDIGPFYYFTQMEIYLEEFRREAGLPLPSDWCRLEAERLLNESRRAGYDLVCGGTLPLLPCGAMRQQAEKNKAQLERNLERSARASAHRKAYSEMKTTS